MPFADYVNLVAGLLPRLGYRQVRIVKPMPIRGKGRNLHGGYDLLARLPDKGKSDLVLVQIKQVERTISRAFVDELRGAMLRLGAAQGVLVTTSAFSRSAVEAVQAGQYVAPVRLVDGKELAMLLHSNARDASPGAPLPAPYHAPSLMSGQPEPQLRRKRARMHKKPAMPSGGRANEVTAKMPPDNLLSAENARQAHKDGCIVSLILDIALIPTPKPRLKPRV